MNLFKSTYFISLIDFWAREYIPDKFPFRKLCEIWSNSAVEFNQFKISRRHLYIGVGFIGVNLGFSVLVGFVSSVSARHKFELYSHVLLGEVVYSLVSILFLIELC